MQNILVTQGLVRIAASLYSKSEPGDPCSVLVLSAVGRDSFSVRAVLQVSGLISKVMAENLALLIGENWTPDSTDEPTAPDFQSGLSQDELTDLVYEHLIFVHDLLSRSSSPLAAYKFTALAFQMVSSLGIKKPIQTLATLHGATLTAINRRLASARSQEFIPSPRKER